jgi:hypothetical protein
MPRARVWPLVTRMDSNARLLSCGASGIQCRPAAFIAGTFRSSPHVDTRQYLGDAQTRCQRAGRRPGYEQS